MSFFNALRGSRRIHLPLLLLLFAAPLFAQTNLAKTTAPQSRPVFQAEADPDFVFKATFEVVRKNGAARVVISGESTADYRLEITPTGLQLWEVVEKQRKLLGAFKTPVTSKNALLIVRRGTLLRVAWNNRNVIEATSTTVTADSVAIYDGASWLKFSSEPRVQPTEEHYLTDDFMATPDAPSKWRALQGTWHIAGAGRPQDSADPFKYVGFTSPGSPPGVEALALNEQTRWYWSDYQVQVSARAMASDSVFGVIFGYRDALDFYGVSWDAVQAPGSGKLRLWRRSGNQTVNLAERDLAAEVGQWYRISVNTFGSQIAVYIDENRVLTANDAHLTGGQVGLYARGGEGAEFDDVHVQSVDSTAYTPAFNDQADTSWQSRTFATDPFMEAWGSSAAEWEKPSAQSQDYWYRAHFFHSVEMRLAANLIGEGTSQKLQSVVLLGSPENEQEGYRLGVNGSQLDLFKNGAKVKSAAYTTGSDLQIRLERGSIRVTDENEKPLLTYADRTAVAGGRVGLRFNKAVSASDIAALAVVKSENLLEYRFDSAPVDWNVESGRWQSTTRWACVPNWNFYGGKGTPQSQGEPVATVWNKRGFGGDQWIETFIAPSEGTSDWMHFAFPVNLNIAFAADGQTLGSGYNLVYRVHDQTTLLYRYGKVVAENKDIVWPDWRSDAMQVYERLTETWQHLQILKQDGRIRIWVQVHGPEKNRLERRLLIDYTDTTPLQGDRLALWTWGINGMSVAKLRVAASQIKAPAVNTLRPQASTPLPVGWRRRVNPINGGAFRVDLKPDAATMPVPALVQFDYKSTPDTALALYAEAGGQLFRANFLGDAGSDGDAITMGDVQKSVVGDERFTARFPLRQALRSFFPAGPLPPVENLYLANLSREPGHVGGLSVSPKGATFEWRPVSHPATIASKPSFKLLSPSGNKLTQDEIRIALDNETADPTEYSVVINGRTLDWGKPGLEWQSTQRIIVIRPARAGLSFKNEENVELSITPFATTTPATASTLSSWSHSWEMVSSTDKTPPAKPAIKVALSGEAPPLPARVESFETGAISWKNMGGEQGATLWRDTSTAASGEASLRLYHRELSGPFGVVVRDQPFDARRFPVLTFSYRVNPAVKATLFVEFDGRLHEIAFTDDDHTYPVIGKIADVKTDNVWRRAEVRLLEAVNQANARRAGSSQETTGKKVPGSTIITRLFFADAGIMNTIQDVAWHIDDFCFVPALSVESGAVLQWNSQDLSGVEGYSWVFDNSPDTLPDEIVETGASAPIARDATYLHVRAKDNAGNWGPASHFRYELLPAPQAQGAAKEAESATAVPTLNAPEFEITIEGFEQIDVESVRLKVKSEHGVKEYSLLDTHGASPAVSFDSGDGKLRWSDASLTQAAGGKRYNLKLELIAQSLAGTSLVRRQWQSNVDPALDKTAPDVPYVSYIPSNRLGRYDFETSMGDVGIRRSAWLVHDSSTFATGRSSARVSNLLGGDFFSVFLRQNAYSVAQYPHVQFDYRFEIPDETMLRQRWRRRGTPAPANPSPPYNLNLVSIVNGEMQIVKFIGGPNAHKAFTENQIGEVEAVRADGVWHQAKIDFGAMLKKRYPDSPRYIAEYFGTWATGPRGYENPRGASMWLDNVTFFSTESDSAAFEWRAPQDGNGISGYSYIINQKPDSVPAEKITTRETRAEFKDLLPGTWYFHLRARDGAGNWGAASHTKFVLTPPAKR